MQTKVQLGKKYKTRNNCTAEVVLIDVSAARVFTAVVTGPNDPEHKRYYTEDGREHQPTADEPQQLDLPYDLIKEITE